MESETPTPVEAPEDSTEWSGKTVEVLPTDTWASIADRCEYDVGILLTFNGGPRPLIAGEELVLP